MIVSVRTRMIQQRWTRPSTPCWTTRTSCWPPFTRPRRKAALAVGLTTPPNSREEGFEANYHGRYHRWGWKRIQHRLVQRMLERLGHREKENIYLVPTELNLDPVDGYPNNNGVHPNPVGYAQIGASFYAWLKAWMAGTWAESVWRASSEKDRASISGSRQHP